MAEPTVTVSKLESVLEKLSTLPAHNSSTSERYTVKVESLFEVQVEASSHYEAALKSSFGLRDLGIRNNTLVEVLLKADLSKFIVQRTENGQSRVYLYSTDVKSYEVRGEEVPRVNATNLGSGAFSFEDGSLIDQTLNGYFGFQEFRPLQKETIQSTIGKDNVLTVLSTGGGKSLTYMLPAVLSTKPTLVICPIKSLIVDQIQRCQQLGISACHFTGDVPTNIIDRNLNSLTSFKLVFSTPEMLEEGAVAEKIYSMFDCGDIERVVFDEAHTISTWGGTFRPTYKLVCQKLANAESVKLLLSATINHKIEKELKEIFGELTVYRHSVLRENLFLEVKEKSSKKLYDDIADFILDKQDVCGIVYAVLPNEVAKIHSELLKRNINAVKYHGQLSEEVKAASIRKWSSGTAKVIIANASFGMGIDRPDVRYVLHTHIPPSMDDYFQQCGRAGRDGSPALCRLYYSYSDKVSLYKLFSHNQENLVVQYANVLELIAFLENPIQCRHKAIMAYYGEVRSNFICVTSCDNCINRGTYSLNDGTSDAIKVVQAVIELSNDKLTCNTLKLFLAKSSQKVIKDNGFDSLTNYGALEKKFTPVLLLEKFLHILIAQDILAEKIEKKGRGICFNVTLGRKAHELLALNVNVHKYEKVK